MLVVKLESISDCGNYFATPNHDHGDSGGISQRW